MGEGANMIVTIEDMIARAEKIDVNKTIQTAVTNTSEGYLDLQRSQMLHGFASDGTRIGKYKNKHYADEKHFLNPLAGRGNVDLRLKGPFQQKLFIKAGEAGVDVDGKDSKTAALMDKYGDRIVGLNEQSSQSYVEEHFSDEANKLFSKQLNGE